MSTATLKKYTRDQFNISAIGREVAPYDLVGAAQREVYDSWKPYFIHDVPPLPPAAEGCYYAFYGSAATDGTIRLGLTLCNGGFDPTHQEIMPFGTDYDRIDARFAIDPQRPDFIELRAINKFRCPDAEPKTRAQAEQVLGEIAGYIRLMNRGHIVNFQRAKIAVWDASRQAKNNPNAISKVWEKTMFGDTPAAKYPVRRLLAAPGGRWPNHSYVPAP
jgi:hypothetical protein